MPNSQNAHQLRALVESLDGMRNQQLYVVWRQGYSDPQIVSETATGDVTILAVETDDLGAWIPSSVQITPQGGTAISLDTYDAVFWSESAFEKFVIPYYSTFWTTKDVANLDTAVKKQGQTVIALAHLPKSEPDIKTVPPPPTPGPTLSPKQKPVVGGFHAFTTLQKDGTTGPIQVIPLWKFVDLVLDLIAIEVQAGILKTGGPAQ